MTLKKSLDGNYAAAEAAKLCRIQVCAAYPITPQTPIVEQIATYIDNGELEAKYINAESEHSALCATIGASLSGARAFTATAGAGLALMHEITGVAAGCRLPIVMPIANRNLPSPWSLWCDHSDSMGERDQGWIQLYAETAQEVLDLIILGYKLAEDERVLLPVNVCLDGFFLSHSPESVLIPDQEEVDEFLPKYEPKNFILDPKNPIAVNVLTGPDLHADIKYQHKQAMDNVLEVFGEVSNEFAEKFDRKYKLIDAYECEDAEFIIIAMGTMAGVVRHVVKEKRKAGEKYGMIKITAFRPFPGKEIRAAVKNAKIVTVIDRNSGLGSLGAAANEIRAALYGVNQGLNIYNFVAGIGGRDVTEKTIDEIINTSKKKASNNEDSYESIWIDVKKGGESYGE